MLSELKNYKIDTIWKSTTFGVSVLKLACTNAASDRLQTKILLETSDLLLRMVYKMKTWW